MLLFLNYIMKILVINMIYAMVQARMGSSRLPGKVMKEVVEKPLLEHIIDRLNFSKEIDRIIIISGKGIENEPIKELCEKLNVDYFLGDENDVLNRYYQASIHFNLSENDSIVRITADCPLIDPMVVDQVIAKHLENNYDYTTNTLVRTFPDGLDCEVFTFNILKDIWQKANLKSEREHVTLYIKNNPENYKLGNLKQDLDLSGLRWTVDEKEDFILIKKIYENLYAGEEPFLMNDIVELLDNNPSLLEINNMYGRNEGLLKSLREDVDLGSRNVDE